MTHKKASAPVKLEASHFFTCMQGDSVEVLDGVLEQPQAVSRLSAFAARPARMVRMVKVPLGVRHQTERQSTRVANSRDIGR